MQQLNYFKYKPKRVLAGAKLLFLINSRRWKEIPRIYLTLRCNLNCLYCSNGIFYDKSEMGYSNLKYDTWIEIISSLKSKTIILSGGEPSLYAGLSNIINAVNKHFLIFTNLPNNFGKFLSDLNKPVSVYASIHNINDGLEFKKNVLSNIRMLETSKNCLYYSVHIVDFENNRKIISDYVDYFQQYGIPITVNRNQFVNNISCTGKFKKAVKCHYKHFYIGPDGNRYICVSKLVRNVKDGIMSYGTTLPEMICDEYGWCSPCDEVADSKIELY